MGVLIVVGLAIALAVVGLKGPSKADKAPLVPTARPVPVAPPVSVVPLPIVPIATPVPMDPVLPTPTGGPPPRSSRRRRSAY